jgi:HAAS
MNLSADGEKRIRGYLFMLESSLRAFLKREVVADAVREVESHIRERVRETEPMPNERDALERVLEAIGPPHRLARAYSAELAVGEAVSSGRLWPTVRAVFALALNTAEGFLVGVALLCGNLLSVACLLVALAKPIFPDNVGIRWVNGEFRGAGWELFLEPGTVVTHGWWVAGICAVVGILLFWLTLRGTRRYLLRASARRARGAR